MSLLDTASLIVTPNGYKEGKLYSVIPSDGSGDMSVTRATTATRVNSAGLVESMGNNVPRLDYSNGTCPSLLVEPQRTNLALYSSSFDSVDWATLNTSITANATTAPDGTTTADKIILNNGSQINPVVYQISDTTANTRTLSFFAKASEYNIAFGRVGGATDAPIVLFSLTGSGSILHNQNVSAYSIEPLENGWYRCSMTYAHGTSFAPNIGVCSATYSVSASSVTSTGNGTSGIYIWGAQLEAGSYATSYIPTTSASVTRNADVISKTGISSLIGQTEGTIFGELEVLPQKSESMLCIIRDLAGGTYDDFFYIRTNNGIPGASVRQGATTYAAITGSTALSQGYHKFALAYKQNDFAFYVDGQLIGTDTSGNVPTCNEVYLGQYIDGVDREVSKKSFALWQTRLTNDELASLTTL